MSLGVQQEMKSRTSCFNRIIFIEDIKRLWGLSALYFISIFFIGPLEIMMRIGDPNVNITYLVENFLGIRGMEVQMILSIIFPIVFSMLIFRYLHTIKSTTVIHSFPITRKELFHSHSLAGFILILIPILLTTILLIGLMAINNDGSILFQKLFTIEKIFSWMGKSLLVNYSIYLIANLTAMITGISLIQGVLACIFTFLPVGLGTLMMVNLDQLLYGFALNDSSIEKFLVKIVPLIPIWANDKVGIGLGLMLWYLLLGLILYVLALYLYKKRHLEKATDPISFDSLKPVFKYGITFCGMVLGGAYLYSMKRVDIWLYLGYVIGGYLGYIIADMLIHKTIWVFKNIKGFIIYMIIVMIAFVGIKADITGFERRMPDDNIESVYYGHGLYSYWNGDQEGLKELDNIASIKELHKEIFENKKEFINKENSQETRIIGLAYKLKSGKTIYRDYTVSNEFVKNNQHIKKIYNSEEYKKSYHAIFNLDLSKVDYIEINPDYHMNRNVKIINDKEIKELMEVIKEDIQDETYEEYNSNIAPWATITFISRENNGDSMYQDYSVHVSWKKSYDKVSDWLKEKGYYEKARVMPDDIDYIIVEKINDDKKLERIHERIALGGDRHGSNKVEIRNEEKIEYLLNNYINQYYTTGKYLVGVYLKNRGDFLGWIDEERLPQDIKDSLE